MYKFKKNFLCAGILDYLLNVILGFIPRIHTKHSPLDTRVTPKYDNKRSLIKNLECIETAESGVDKVVSSCEKNPNVHEAYMNFLRQRKTALDAPLHAVSSGRSMIEMLGVLAIVGVLSVGGIAGYSKAMEKFKINKTIEQVAQIATNIRTLYAQQKDFSGLNNTTAIQMGVVPDEMSTSGGTESYGQYYGQDIATVFGGNVFIRGEWDGETFAIELRNITKNACVSLATADWGATDLSGIVGLIVGYASDPGSHIFAYTNKDEMGGEYDYDCQGDKYDERQYIACSGINFPVSPAIAAKFCEIMPNVAIRFHK